MEYFSSINESDKRYYLASIATDIMGVGVRTLCKYLEVSKDTIYKGIFELNSKIEPRPNRIRKSGGGAKHKTDKHPEWMVAFLEILDVHLAGLPQDENTQWLDISVAEVRRLMLEKGYDVLHYIARQIIDTAELN